MIDEQPGELGDELRRKLVADALPGGRGRRPVSRERGPRHGRTGRADPRFRGRRASVSERSGAGRCARALIAGSARACCSGSSRARDPWQRARGRPVRRTGSGYPRVLDRSRSRTAADPRLPEPRRTRAARPAGGGRRSSGLGVVLMSVSERTRSGSRSASCWMIMPPSEIPMK